MQDANAIVANTTSTVSFTVGAASSNISATANTTAQSLTVGTAMSSFSPLTPSGGALPYTYSVTSGTLPAGLILDVNTGAVTGTPTAAQTAASVVFSVQDANGHAASTTSTVSFTVVSGAITATATTTAQSLTVGTAMASFSPLTPIGGVSPYTYSIATGTLPAGLSLNATTGAVTGKPTTIQATRDVEFSVADYNGVIASITSTVSFTVGAASATIVATATATQQNLYVGWVMASFSPLTPSGGAAPYTYSITSGILPAGLSLNTTTGAITGTPSATTTGTRVTFSVKDANGQPATTTNPVTFIVAILAGGYAYEGGLTWMPASASTYTYAQAVTVCLNQSFRLPTAVELSNLYGSRALNGLSNWTLGRTWSSTPLVGSVPSQHDDYYLNLGFPGTSADTGTDLVTCVH